MDTENKTVGLEINVPECLNEAAGNLANPLTKSVGQTMADIWDIVFGGVGELAERTRLLRVHKLEQFKAELEGKVESIPPEKLVPPDTQVVAGALDDARYCVEKDELRQMFSNLIAASLNSDTVHDVHPSFSNIIRRMSPFDANLLLKFKNDYRKPIVHYVLRMESGGTLPFLKNVISSELHDDILQQESRSLEVLKSLGLIDIDFSQHFVKDSNYDALLSNPLYVALKNSPEKVRTIRPNIIGIDCLKGIVTLTDLGSQFLKVCL